MDRIIIITIVILTSIVQLSTPTRRSIGTPSPPIGWNRTSGLPRSSMLRGGPRRKRERAPISRQQQYNCGVCPGLWVLRAAPGDDPACAVGEPGLHELSAVNSQTPKLTLSIETTTEEEAAAAAATALGVQ